MKRKLEVISEDKFEDYLKEVKENYRPYDPANYLYKLLLNKNIDEKLTIKGIELLYTTLIAWNMNSRAAKLSEFEIFSDSVLKNKDKIKSLSKKRLELSDFNKYSSELEKLFYDLSLVWFNDEGVEKPRLVTFAKTMHFLLPELCMPIDRRYTLNFFYNNTNTHNTNLKDRTKKLKSQFKKYTEIFQEFERFAKSNSDKLRKYEDPTWNLGIPKIIDNLIIAYVKLEN
jgi:hypothetical protein